MDLHREGAADPTQFFRAIDTASEQPSGHMRICVDARMLGSDGTGVARYARTLVDSLTEAGVRPLLLHADPDNTSRLSRWIAAPRFGPRFACTRTDSKAIVARDVFREAQMHFDLYGRLMPVHCDGPPGVMHWTYPIPITMCGWRNVYTVHDVIPIERQALSPIRSKRHHRMLRAIARSADRLVTVSEAARLNIIAALGCDSALVTNASQAVSVSSNAQAVSDIGEGQTYFLFCGTLEPRKNLTRLAEAYALSGARRKLVIIGPDGWQAESIRKTLNHPGIIILPFQTRERLLRIMAHARGLLFPSLSEGFGLPIAEAMTLGTPVMTSIGGATGEVAGNAALLVDPLDVTAMAAAIHRLDNDDALCQQLSAAGTLRSPAFHARPYVRRLVKIYAELFDLPSPTE